MKRGRRGVSSVVGMTIFLLLFAIAVAYIFTWSQSSGYYLDTIKRQTDFEMSRLTENLIVRAINYSWVEVENPTTQVIVVRTIWSGGNRVWDDPAGVGIAPYSKLIFPNNTGSGGNGNFTVVTTRGNIFSGGLQAQIDKAKRQSWEVSWYWRENVNSSTHNLLKPINITSNQYIGTTYWYDLNLNYEWKEWNNPVIGSSYSMKDQTMLGFVATTTLVKLTDGDATINFYNSTGSRIAIGLNGTVPSDWINPISNPVVISGPKYMAVSVAVYFDGYGTAEALIRLNIVNATFVP